MEKINIAELLKDCPKGMELYSPMYGVGKLSKITNKIHVKFPKQHNVKCFRLDGKVSEEGEIMLFPNGKTTWEGFVPPCKFKDGDIVATYDSMWIGITTGGESKKFIPTYCVINYNNELNIYFNKKESWTFDRFATEEEKVKLFQTLKDNGYKWNTETKTLEKLVEPKFKVGDEIEKLGYRFTIIQVNDNNYLTKCGNKIPIDNQDDFTLVPNKFDITTLIPFESRVLVRHNKDNKWCGSFFSFIDRDHHSYCYKFVTTSGKSYPMMIPYKGNEHLLGTNNDCAEYYKNWE